LPKVKGKKQLRIFLLCFAIDHTSFLDSGPLYFSVNFLKNKHVIVNFIVINLLFPAHYSVADSSSLRIRKQLNLNDKIPSSAVSASQKYDTKVSEGSEFKTDTIPLSLEQLSLNGSVATPPITKSRLVTAHVNANHSNVKHSWSVISKSAESNNIQLKVEVGITNSTTAGENLRAINTDQVNSSNIGFGNPLQNNVETRKLEAIVPLHRKSDNLAQAFAQSCKNTHILLRI